jgi:hypothetical protein
MARFGEGVIEIESDLSKGLEKLDRVRMAKKTTRSRTKSGAYRKKRSDAGKPRKKKSFWDKVWG